jgi:Uma2 family endonuclease
MTTLPSLHRPGSVAPPITLHLDPIIELDDDQLFELCHRNPDLRIERTAAGELLVMSPTGSKTSFRNAALVAQLYLWAQQDGRGLAFDSSGGFLLPNGAMRAPDAAWVERSQLRGLADGEGERFLPLCPAFVIELRSSSDSLPAMQAKMEEYRAAGARLGWLIDPEAQQVHVYRPGAAVEILEKPSQVSGDPELSGFRLDLEQIWTPGW